jgi:hypothetical protein
MKICSWNPETLAHVKPVAKILVLISLNFGIYVEESASKMKITKDIWLLLELFNYL